MCPYKLTCLRQELMLSQICDNFSGHPCRRLFDTPPGLAFCEHEFRGYSVRIPYEDLARYPYLSGKQRQGLAPARKNLHTQKHSKLLAEVPVALRHA